MIYDLQNINNIITALILEVNELKAENKELKLRLAKYETPKNSSNSSIPPSKDENRPQRRSLREKTGRKPGGQHGRKGNTLKKVSIPDIMKKICCRLLHLLRKRYLRSCCSICRKTTSY